MRRDAGDGGGRHGRGLDAASVARTDDDQWAFAADVAGAVAFDERCATPGLHPGARRHRLAFEHDAHPTFGGGGLRDLLGRPTAARRPWPSEQSRGSSPDRGRPGGRDESVRGDVRRRVAEIASVPADRQRRALVDAGYLTPHWPEPHGLGADAVTQLVIDEELKAAEVERPDLKIGGWAAPTILAHGSEEQRDRFVRPTLLGG